MYLLKYRLTDGLIVGTWSANTEELLVPNIVDEDPLYGYLLSTSTVSPRDLQERHWVDEDTLETKTESTLAATPNPFDADGIDECDVTVTPFVPCTLLVNGSPNVLTTEDQILVLTAEAPVSLVITMAPLASHWADPITVEAI